MTLDTYNDHSPNAPYNQGETEKLTELELQQEWNQELLAKVKRMKAHLQKLSEIERDLATFGTITFEQQKEKQEILNKY